MFEAFGLSDPGCVRANNEDYFINDSHLGIFVLADGMGGANSGEYAAYRSSETVYDFLISPAAKGTPDPLRQGFLRAHQAVRQDALQHPEFAGMGTTLLVAQSTGNGALQLASVGDSRGYLLSRGALTVQTHDQTWVAEVGSRLGLSEKALSEHPMRHVLTMAVGTSEQLEIGFSEVHMRPRDQLALCSDGLYGVVPEKIFRNILDSEKSLPDKCHYLVDAARERGGPDNITVILVRLL